MIKAVIFDMDGVIIDSEHIHYKIFEAFTGELGISVPPAEYNSLVGSTDLKIWTYFKEKYRLSRTIEDLVEAYASRYINYLLTAKAEKPIGGVEELIEDYAGNGLKLALASSASRENIEIVLEMFGFNRHFQASVSGFEVCCGKPAPDIFLRAAELLAVKPEDCAVIEDTKNGVGAAKAAGMKCIAYRNPNSGNQDLSAADIITDSFAEVKFEKIKGRL